MIIERRAALVKGTERPVIAQRVTQGSEQGLDMQGARFQGLMVRLKELLVTETPWVNS